MKGPTKMLAIAVAVVATVVSTAAPSQARATWDTTPVAVHHDVTPTPAVVNLRVGEHSRFDRVVIDLRGKVPGYTVRARETFRVFVLHQPNRLVIDLHH